MQINAKAEIEADGWAHNRSRMNTKMMQLDAEVTRGRNAVNGVRNKVGFVYW